MLNDPQKRSNYDTYGVADLEGIDLEDFMDSFGAFDDFLSEILSVRTLSLSSTVLMPCSRVSITRRARKDQGVELAEEKENKKGLPIHNSMIWQIL